MAPVRAVGAAKLAFEKYGVNDYVVDCDYELDKLIAETKQPKKLRIFVRIATPLGGAVLELSSKFGTAPAEAAKLLKRVAESGAQPCITFHVGSQCLSPFSYAQAIEMARRTALLAKVEIAALDIGGGFPGPYQGDDVPPYHWYFDTIKEALETLPDPKIPVICEPGRALIAEGMSLITQVILRKGDRLYINDGVYGSFDELTLPGWNADYPVRVFTLDAKGRALPLPGATLPFRVYGPTCDTLDVLPRPIMLPANIAPGDFIVFDAMGAIRWLCARPSMVSSRHLGNDRELSAMSDAVEPLMDLLEWVCDHERDYAEMMEAWRTSCPKLPVWKSERARSSRAS
jgi:ornithine decarboxylase